MSRRRKKLSAAQLEANRLNAQKSTGPRTEEGKNKCKLNAFRHGLTSQVAVMTDPDRDAQEKFIKAYVADVKPEGAQETQLVQALAFECWRMNRIRTIEENEFAFGFNNNPGNIEALHPEIHAAMTQSYTFFSKPEKFALLSLYEQRLHRNFHRNMNLWRELKKEREARVNAQATAEVEKPMTMAAGATAAAPETARPVAETRSNAAPIDAQVPVVSTTHEVNGSVYSNWNVKNVPPRNPLVNAETISTYPGSNRPEDENPLVNAETIATYPHGIRPEDENPLVNTETITTYPGGIRPEDENPLVNAETISTYPGGIRPEDEGPRVKAA